MEQFQRMIRELQDGGLSQKALGELIGKSQAWVGSVLSGHFKDLKWSDGEALRTLHANLCKPQTTTVSPAPTLEQKEAA